jgi:hypothetical protein
MIARRVLPRLALTAIAAAVALGGVLFAQADQAAPPALPVPAEFVRKVREAIRLDYELQKGYTYVEKRRDVKVSSFGKVYVGPLRTFEVYPSNDPGKTYKRLIAIEGKPLDPAELARRDQEHQQSMLGELERQKHETAAQRAAREKEDADERRQRDAMVNDAFAVFEPLVAGRETIDGEPVLVASLTPRRYVQPKTREGRWMTKFIGRVWVSETDYQIVRVDMTVRDPLTIGMGFVGRVHEGSRLVVSRRKVNNEVWLPAELKVDASGRTLLFRPFTLDTVTTYSDYRKWSVETSVTYGASPKSLP